MQSLYLKHLLIIMRFYYEENKLIVFTATLLLSSAGFISTASADVTLKHGYIDVPPSSFPLFRKRKNLNKDCGQYSMNLNQLKEKGFPNDGPADRSNC